MFFFVNNILLLSEACCKVKIILQCCSCVRSLSLPGGGAAVDI